MRRNFLISGIFIAAGIIAGYLYYNSLQPSLTIVYSSDIQGRSEAFGDAYKTDTADVIIGGLEYYVSFIKKERYSAESKKRPFIYLDSGNFFAGGSVRSNLSRGRMMVEVFNRLRLDGLAPGLKDFAFGEGNLGDLAGEADFPFLSCNMFREGAGAFNYIKPYIIKYFSKLKAAVIGVSRPFERGGIFSGYFEGIGFLNPADTLRRYIPELKKEGVDLIIVVSNLGRQADIRLAEEIKGIDVIVGGGDSEGLRESYFSNKNKTIIPDSFHKAAIGYALDLTLDKGGKIKGYKIRYDDIYVNKLRPDPEVKAIIERYREDAGEVIGYSQTNMDLFKDKESVLGNWLADALRRKTGADIAIAGGLAAGLKEGRITLGDVLKISPFVNRLDLIGFNVAVMEMPGEEIKELLESGVSYGLEKGDGLLQVSGMSYVYDLRRRRWNRVVEMKIGEGNLELGRAYKVALNSYLASGLGGYYNIKAVKKRYDTGLMDFDVLLEQVKNNSPLNAQEAEGRIVEIK